MKVSVSNKDMTDFLQKNYFELFDFPLQFDLSCPTLRVRYRNLQASVHPDQYAGGTAQERRLAVQFSALINQAYLTLKDPLQRGRYLLSLLDDVNEPAHTVQDTALLLEQMSLREEFDEIKKTSPVEVSRLMILIEKIETRQQAVLTDLSACFQHMNETKNTKKASKLLDKYQFFSKLHDEVLELT
ncbi:MAG: Fe-S protein assembly co-chaperone HscB [Gammaproteobacteria bacterium]|nr:Fe-S protein assembly co-chaperone HscB [Gammaproteobacteria bacterium]